MTAREHRSEDTFDVATVTADDRLLDALGRGEAAPRDDEVAGLLAAWRAELAVDMPTVRKPAPAGVVDLGQERVRRGWRPLRMLITAAAAVIVIGGSLTLAAGGAGPDSPLWPITQLIYSERAQSRQAQQDAEQAITKARQAIDDGRYTDAEKQLNEAKGLIGQIHDQQVAHRLLDEVAAVTGLLPRLINQPSHPAGGGPQPTGSARGGGGGGGDGGGGGGNPEPTQSAGGLPLPSLPLPLPTLSLSLPPVLGGH
jgi:uncharacterized membrane protein YgcG